MTDLNILQEFEQEQAEPPPHRGLSLAAIVVLIGVALTVLVFGIALVRVQQGRPTAGPAPDFSLTTLDGKPFHLSDEKGKVIVINFWASWCEPCRQEAPALESLWQQYQNQNVVFLGITYADDPKDSEAFMQQFGMTYPVADDGHADVSKGLYRIQGVPETFVIDKQGNIQSFFYSVSDDSTSDPADYVVSKGDLAKLIDTLLAKS